MLSGDSTVKSYSFNGETVEFLYDDYDTNEEYRVKVETSQIFTQATGGEGIVHMRIEEISDKLEVEPKSGRYMMPSLFSKQMAIFKQGYHIFGGMKASEYPKAFILSMGTKILVCPIKSTDSVIIKKA